MMKNNEMIRNILKKSLLMVLALIMVLSVCACGAKPNAEETTVSNEAIVEIEETEIIAETEQIAEETTPTDVGAETYDIDPNLMDEDGEAPRDDGATIPGDDDHYFA